MTSQSPLGRYWDISLSVWRVEEEEEAWVKEGTGTAAVRAGKTGAGAEV